MRILIISIIFAFLDQLTKYIAVSQLDQPYSLIASFFTLRLEKNFGIAFSIPVPSMIVLVFTVLFLLWGFWWAKREFKINKLEAYVSLGFIGGGAIGNLIDRVHYGYVIDFVSIWKWPVFNLADVGIFIGVLGILLFYGKIKKK